MFLCFGPLKSDYCYSVIGNLASDDQLSWDEDFEDSYLAEFEMASDADLKNGTEVEPRVVNPFAFGN